MLERKQIELEVKADKAERIIKGFAAMFGNVDSDGDLIEKGAFANTIIQKFREPEKSKIKMLWLHGAPLGIPVVLEERDKGLYFEAKVSKTQMGDEALELVKDGVVDGASIGFRTKRFERVEQDDEHGGQLKRIIKEIDLYEVSPVIWGANDLAFAEVEKSASELHEFYTQLKKGRVMTPEDRKGLREAMALLQRVLESGKKSDESEGDDPDKDAPEQEDLEAKCIEWMGEEFLAELDSFTEQIA